MTQEEFGTIVKERRIARGMKQDDLAKMTNMPRGNISRIESGKVALTIKMMSRVLDALGMKITIEEGQP